MTTTFIALQCFQCSTMQVKQQKKSSNKWTCVVCNQRQSVRKVFAQGFMAKDVRKFVQSFNMSRQLSDQKQQSLLEEEEEEEVDEDLLETSTSQRKNKKRNDWSEYVDDDDKDENREAFCGDAKLAQGDSELEARVVTEIPKALFKKPKLKDYSARGYSEKLLKPVFPNRSSSKRHQSEHPRASQTSYNETRALDVGSDEGCNELHVSDRSSKWSHFRAQVRDYNSLAETEDSFVRKPTEVLERSTSKWSGYVTQDKENRSSGAPLVPLNQTKAANGSVSKWSSFMTEEDDDYDSETKETRNTFDHKRTDGFELLGNDERVEEDIHPDFL